MIHCTACDASLGPKVLDNVQWGIWECTDDGPPAAVFIEYELRDKPKSKMRMLVFPVEMAEWLIDRWHDGVEPRLAGDRSVPSR